MEYFYSGILFDSQQKFYKVVRVSDTFSVYKEAYEKKLKKINKHGIKVQMEKASFQIPDSRPSKLILNKTETKSNLSYLPQS